ncbi:MAG: DUF1003 domain-containing protein [Caulobacter sp.]|nr:DUF1003 domain-containing protein [Caulobacter sp.]
MTNAIDRRDELSRKLLSLPYTELNPVQRSVIDLMIDDRPTSVAAELRTDDRSFWERMADHVAAVGGSWGFIFGFALALAAWTGTNLVLMLWGRAFDPYPFIFLNLLLSTLAAIQAPVIMMSQNRLATKDRAAAEHDAVVNLRAELEIMLLHEKLDTLRDGAVMTIMTENRETLDLVRQQLAALSKKID